MSSQTFNQTPYLRTSWDFPEDAKQLSIELDRSFIDVANSINDRTIGIYASNKPVVNGETWFYDQNKKYQALRKIYSATSFANIPHNINTNNLVIFTKISGGFISGTTFYPLPYVHPTAANQVGIQVSSSNIVFNVGGSAPSPSKVLIILEWLSQT